MSFEGHFKNGLPEGSITRTSSYGRKDKGNFINGYFEGKITIEWHRHRNSQRFDTFEGYTKSGQINGQGKLIYKKGSMIPELEAQIDEGEFSGDMSEPILMRGKRTLPNGSVAIFKCGTPVEIMTYYRRSSPLDHFIIWGYRLFDFGSVIIKV